jgi:hypothetical protein
MMSATLTAAERARLDSCIIDIAEEARGAAAVDAGGVHRFGGKGALCIYPNGQWHDFSAGAHGFNALQLIEHLHPGADAVALARPWLDRHAGAGGFIPGESEPANDFAEIEAAAFIGTLHGRAGALEGTPGHLYLTQTRGLPVAPEDAALLRWAPNYRGEEGALLAPVTDNNGKIVKLLLTYIAPDGLKSPHTPCRITLRGAKGSGMLRLGTPGVKVVEVEGLEKGLAARAGGAEYVVVSGGAGNLGRAPLPPVVQTVVIARDDDPPGSEADCALWRGVVRRLGQGLKVAVTERPNAIAPKDAPPLKDLDDVWRFDPELVPILLNGASLEHGRLGDAVDGAILEVASHFNALEDGRARKGGIAGLLGVSTGKYEDQVHGIVRERIEKSETALKAEEGPEPWPTPVIDIGAVLDDVVKMLKRILSTPDTHCDTEALWAAKTHLLPRAQELRIRHSARLLFLAVFEDSGKTTAMTALQFCAARAMTTSSLSGASLFRETDANQWTVLWDEADNSFHKNTSPELIGIFNAGHDRKFAIVHRQVPDKDGKFDTRSFNTFTGISMTAQKEFPSKAMQSRCIVLNMQRASRDESRKLEDFSEEHEAALEICGRKLMRWATDLGSLPTVDKKATGLINRIWLNWKPLLQIAECAGGTWPARALAAAKADMARIQAGKTPASNTPCSTRSGGY